MFWSCGQILKKNIRLKRIFLGVLFTTFLYCIVIFYFAVFNNWISFLILLIGILFVFRPSNFFEAAKIMFFVNLIGFVLGGMATSLFYFFDMKKIFLGIENFSFKILFGSSLIFFVIIKLFAEYIKKAIITKEVCHELNILLGKKKINLLALVDTGNCLFDKLTGLPIIIVELGKIKNIFSHEIFMAIKNKNLEALCLCQKIKFSFVPFKSVGNQNGLLICFRPDQIKILGKKKINIVGALIGICDFKISSDYCGLINPELIK